MTVKVRELGTKAQLDELTEKNREQLRLGNIVRNVLALHGANHTRGKVLVCRMCDKQIPAKEFQLVKPANGDPKYRVCNNCAVGKTSPRGLGQMQAAMAALAE